MTTITTFIITLIIAFFLMLTMGLLVNYCKRRQSRTSHGLTGMCHQTGGTMCGSCSSQLQDPPVKTILPRAEMP